MNRWWRAYDEAVDDPKLQQLPDALFKAWFNVCCITSQNDGALPAIEQIAFKLRLSVPKAKNLIERLQGAGLVDEGDGVLTPHNWHKRQFKSDVTDPTAAERMRRHRNSKRNGHRNDTVTVTDPETEADTDSEPEAENGSSHLPSPIESKNLSIGEAKREAPRHCATTSRAGGRVYVVKGTSEWESYADDFRRVRGQEPNVNSDGGRWFKTLGESANAHDQAR